VFYDKNGKAILDSKSIRKLADLVAQRGFEYLGSSLMMPLSQKKLDCRRIQQRH